MNASLLKISQDKIVQILGLSILTLIIFLLCSIFKISLLFPSGVIILALLIILILRQTKATLFFLIIVRMLLDHPSQIFSLNVSEEITLTYSQILGILIFITGIFYLTKNFKNITKLPLKYILSAYFLFSFLTLFYSIDAFSTIKELIRLADLAILYFITYDITKTSSDFTQIIKILIISSILPVLIAIYQFISGIGYTDTSFDSPRIFGTLSHPNSLSLYLSAIIALLFFYHFSNRSNRKKQDNFYKFIFFLIPIYFIVLTLTYSRIAWIAIFAFIGVIGILRYRKILISFILIAFFAYLFSSSIQQRTLDALSQAPGSSLQWRTVIWKDTINYTFDNNQQVNGFGIGTFETVAKIARGELRGSLAPHNDYVKHFVEGGYVGLLIYILILIAILSFIFRNYIQARDNQPKIYYLILLAFFVALIVSSLSDNVLLNTPLQWIFWIFLGAGLKNFSKKAKH